MEKTYTEKRPDTSSAIVPDIGPDSEFYPQLKFVKGRAVKDQSKNNAGFAPFLPPFLPPLQLATPVGHSSWPAEA